MLLDVVSVGNILHLIGQVHDYSCFSGPVIVQKCWRVYITPLPTSHNRGQPSTKYSQGLVTTVPVPSPLRQSYSEVCVFRSFQGGSVVKESTCQYRRFGFDPWVGKTPVEKEMATHSSFLAWEIPWTEEPGGLQSMESHRVRHD